MRHWERLLILATTVAGCRDATAPATATPSLRAVSHSVLPDRPTPTAVAVLSGFTGFFPPPLTNVPDCAGTITGGVVSLVRGCTIKTGQAVGAVRADIYSTHIGAKAVFQTGGSALAGGVNLDPGEVVTFGAVGRLDYTVSMQTLGPLRTPDKMAIWFYVDGALQQSYGHWDGPSSVGVTHTSNADAALLLAISPSIPALISRITVRTDGISLSGGLTLITPQAYTRQATATGASASIRKGIVRSPFLSWTSANTPVFLSLGLQTQNFLINQTTGPLRYWGAADTVNFLNTGSILSVQVLDAEGNDISEFFAATVDGGQPIPTGPAETAVDAAKHLRDAVDALVPDGIGKALSAQLAVVVEALSNNRQTSACSVLSSVGQLLSLQSGKQLSSELAMAWSARVALIESLAECGTESSGVS